ncbi:MAG: SufS family cysteine desulfurase [Planctomycetaceae bacterium]
MLITTAEIFEEFEGLDPRDQSQYLLELGYDLPRFEDSQKRDEDLVHGCQSQVWLTAQAESGDPDPVIHIEADSDAEIVRGLITILLASYSGQKASRILSLPITDVFDRLNLKQYISPQRQNGLQGMVDRIRSIARSHLHTDRPEAQDAIDAAALLAAGSRRTSPPAVRPRKSEDTSGLNAEELRRQFPVLNQKLDGNLRPVYLDSGASAQKPQVVIDKEREVEQQYFANAYRGRYSFGARVDEEMEAARQIIADFLNAPSATQVAFTPGCTSTLNMIAFGWAGHHVQPGEEILITPMEHHANFVPWQQVAQQRQAELKMMPLTDDGRIDLERLDTVLTKRTRVVAVTGMSNVLGTVNPIAELARRAHDVGAVIVVDGAQSIPHLTMDVVAEDVDFLAFSGHKLYGPTGVGVLYGKAERLDEMQPTVFGGHMISRVFADHSTWAPAPAKFEAGTLPIVQAIALGTAVRWVQEVGLERIHQHEQHLLKTATEQLSQISGLTIYGPAVEHKGAIVSFRLKNLHPEDLAALLDRRAVLTRHGHHCTMPLHDLLKVSATTRASFAAYNTEEDVQALVDGILWAQDVMRCRSTKRT